MTTNSTASRVLAVLMNNKALVYGAFLVLFWLPLALLLRFGDVTGNEALIAAVVGVVPLLLLFVPLFERLAGRVSAVKIGGFELDLQTAVADSVVGRKAQQLGLYLDPGHEVMYEKADLRDFADMLARFAPLPSRRLVLKTDLKDGHRVHIAMLYFQSRVLDRLFDLRALLFVDSRQTDLESRVLGTMPPLLGWQLMEHYYPELEKAWREGLNATQLSATDLLDAQHAWARFRDSIAGSHLPTLTDDVFRTVFAGWLEANFISLPLTDADYPRLIEYLSPLSRDRAKSHEHLILVREQDIVNVRTIDRVARELSRSLLLALVRKEASQSEAGASGAHTHQPS